MRRVGGVALGLFFAAGSPAWAAGAVVHATDAPGWDVQVVDIQPGEKVTWTFAGTTQAHNVQSAANDWGTRVAVVPEDFTWTFPTAGTFRVVCQVHPDTMYGDVRVADVPPPPPPPPPLSAQPFVNDVAAPVPAETAVALDTTRPALASLSVARRSHGARVRFKVSEQSVIDVGVTRGGRLVKSVAVRGSGARGVTVAGLPAGRYVVRLRATDVAGNRSKLRSLRVTVR
jgi:plastocyanin